MTEIMYILLAMIGTVAIICLGLIAPDIIEAIKGIVEIKSKYK